MLRSRQRCPLTPLPDAIWRRRRRCRGRTLFACLLMSALAFIAIAFASPRQLTFSFRASPLATSPAQTVPTPLAIPPLLHFTAASELLRIEYLPLMQRWLTHVATNLPGARFHLWRNADAACLARIHYGPGLTSVLVNNTRSALEQADLIRVMALHTLGGLYVDLDTELLGNVSGLFGSPLAGAMLATEPEEHAVLLWGQPSLASNAVMFSAPGHPFFAEYIKAMVTTLTSNEQFRKWRMRFSLDTRRLVRDSNDAPVVTGPVVMQRIVNSYQLQPPVQCSSPACRIHLFKPEVFSPLFDPLQQKGFRLKCRLLRRIKDPNQLRVCKRLKTENFIRGKITRETLAMHLFSHRTTQKQRWGRRIRRAFRYFNASAVFPQLILYSKTAQCGADSQ